MPGIIVLGGGVCGLAAAMLLARDGHEVTVLERDPEPVPDTPEAACEAWARRGVAQFRQPHYLQPRGRAVLEEELADVADALARAGGYRFDVLSVMPPSIADRAPRPGDERFVTLTGRRPVVEQVVARAAGDEPGVDVRRGVGVEALVTRARNGTPHVAGVRTDRGEELRADLVVDAMGRRSILGRWLADAGAPLHEEGEDAGFIYYTRFFRVREGGSRPEFRSAPLTPLESFSILTLPADNDTWSVTLYIDAGDRALKAMRHADRWDAVLAACPRHAHWRDGDPISDDVLAMGGVVDRYRRLAPGGRPVATGVAALADAWAATNPSAGRGITMGLLHARALRDVAREHVDDPPAFAAAWDERTERELAPWYRTTVTEDRARLRSLRAARTGTSPPPAPEVDAAAALLPVAAGHDADLFRAYVETRACLAPLGEVMTRPGLAERVLELARDGASPPPGPTRDELRAILS